jgi:hypothetical protein
MKFKEGKLDIRYLALGICFLFLLGIVSADIVSINSGGDDQLVINPGSGIEDFFFNFNLRPLMSNVILSSTFGTNFTTENLTVTYTSSDPDGDTITNISDWRLNGNSISVLNLPFDSYKTQGEIRDYSTYENNGTLGGGDNNKVPSWKSDCQVGGCYEFDGVDDVIYAPHQGGNEITVSMWINRNDLVARRSTKKGTGTGVGQFIMRFYNGDFGVYLGGGTPSPGYHMTSGGGITQGNWHYIVWTYEGNLLKLYVDGELINEISVFRNSSFDNTDIKIAEPYGLDTEDFNGSIDEFKIFNRVLSGEMIKELYFAGYNGHSMETLVSQETDKGDVWQVAMTSNDGFYDSITVLSNELEIVNDAPDDPEDVTLVSVDGTNESDVDLNCSAYVEDSDNEFLNVYVNWFKDGDSVLNQTFTDWENGTIFNSLLDESNLTLGDVWYCSVRTYDSSDYSNWVDSNELEIIDITDPIVNIISPEHINYSVLNVSFNVSVIENENVSMCFYDLDYEGNVSMNELNDSYFWSEPSLGPGFHEVWFYCNDTSGNWGMNYTNFTIENEAAIAILLSEELMQQVRWNVLSLPIDDLDAIGNNGPNETDYYVNISATNTLVDLYVKADGDLFNSGGDSIGLRNETFGVSLNDSTVSNVSKIVMNTSYILIGSGIGDNSTVYMKFYLDAPSSQAAGQYLNQLDFKAVREGEAP